MNMGSTPDPDRVDEIEQYQRELSQQTDNGCGCTEMWETLSEMRRD
jgi:hypothetical protein